MSKIGILMGSSSDEETVKSTTDVLDQLGIDYEVRVMSAHRSPEKVMEYTTSARDRGIEIIIAAAGGAAALPGVISSWTTLPVIGIPLTTSELNGIDSLMAIAQMPPGVPVACVAVGSWGAKNAAYLAASILALKYETIRESYEQFRSKQKGK